MAMSVPRLACWALSLCLIGAADARAQIDSTERELLELGYDHPLSGAGPTAGYAFAYLNKPDVLRRGSALRLAVAPVYADGEYGIGRALGPSTDLGIGLAGGGFAQSHTEVRRGQYLRPESFYGHGATASLAAYRRLNPGRMIPLTAIARQSVQYSDFERMEETSPGFELPPDHATFVTRLGLRFGGQQPTMPPSDALEISTWYEGRFKDRRGTYGRSGDRTLQSTSHLLWLKTVFVRVQPGSGRRVGLGVSAGTSVNADRLNAFGLGGLLPLTSDFPREIPGYYNEELTARRFALFSGQYGIPIGRKKCFLVNLFGTSALVSYVPGLEQQGSSQSGFGLGLQYDSPSHAWNVLVNYGYGIDAIRSGSRGAHSVGLTLQFDRLVRRPPAQPLPVVPVAPVAPVAPLPAFKH